MSDLVRTHLDQLALIVRENEQKPNDRLECFQAEEGRVTLVFSEEGK
jgi:hypothetical protein